MPGHHQLPYWLDSDHIFNTLFYIYIWYMCIILYEYQLWANCIMRCMPVLNRGPQNLRDTPCPPTVVASILTTRPWPIRQKWIGTSWPESYIGYNSESSITILTWFWPYLQHTIYICINHIHLPSLTDSLCPSAMNPLKNRSPLALNKRETTSQKSRVRSLYLIEFTFRWDKNCPMSNKRCRAIFESGSFPFAILFNKFLKSFSRPM